MTLFAVERHALGPRVHVLGRRVHECHLGLERVIAHVLRVADRWFQLERLLRFNAKFDPTWRPRYLLFAGPAQLPRVALGALSAEGQLPAPRLPRRRTRTEDRTGRTALAPGPS